MLGPAWVSLGFLLCACLLQSGFSLAAPPLSQRPKPLWLGLTITFVIVPACFHDSSELWVACSRHNSFFFLCLASLPRNRRPCGTALEGETRSEDDSNIMEQRKKTGEGGHRVLGARWQQRHVPATCPGEYELFSRLLFSQYEMTLAPLSACLGSWLGASLSFHLAVCQPLGWSGGLTFCQLASPDILK